MKKLGLLLLITVYAPNIRAQYQRLEPHSLALGFNSGSAKVDLLSEIDQNTSVIGINLNHQRNFVKWFSFRTGLNANYLFPINSFERTAFSGIGSVYKTGELTEYNHFQLLLDFMPTFYYRDDGFNLFLGFSGTFGGLVRKLEFSTQYHKNGEWPVYEDVEQHSKTHIQVGYGPVAGVGFDLGGKKSGGEIEISFSYKSYYYMHNSEIDNSMKVFGILTAYRYYFKK